MVTAAPEFLELDSLDDSTGLDVGRMITREQALDELVDHELESFGRDARAYILDFAFELHKGMKQKTGGPPARHHHRLWGGPKGYGKSGGANLDAAKYYLLGGDVFSMSGLMYGYRVPKEKFYTFSDSMPQKAWMLIDEVHMFVDSHGQALRNQVVEENDALLRKKSARMDATSTKSHRLPPRYLEEVDCVFFPTPYTPKKVKMGNPNWGLPPFCFVYLDCIGPRPFSPKDLRDEWKIAPKWEKTRHLRKVVDPIQLYITMHMYDSWTAPDLGSGLTTTASDIRDALQDNDSQADTAALVRSFFTAVNMAFINGWTPSGKSMHIKHVIATAQAYGNQLDESDIKDYLAQKGCVNSGNRITTDVFISEFMLEEAWQRRAENGF